VVKDIAIMIPNGLGIIFNLINILTLIFLRKSDSNILLEKDYKENLNNNDQITYEDEVNKI
jgi:hypothetical protein